MTLIAVVISFVAGYVVRSRRDQIKAWLDKTMERIND